MRGPQKRKTRLARRLRRDSTIAERGLWNAVRARSLFGVKFVRQVPIGPYIVDLVCREQHVIIEVDGGQHAESKRDAARDRWLHDQGYRVLRFWNNDVLVNIDGVLETIAVAVGKQSALTSPMSEQASGDDGVSHPIPASHGQ
jgi:very-short-patch-repair endonuclease